MWYQSIVSGPGFDDGSFRIGYDFSLVFHRPVLTSDEGRYICRVANHNLLRISNHTDVKILGMLNNPICR